MYCSGNFGLWNRRRVPSGEVYLVHASAPQREDGMHFLHHVDVVQAVQIAPAPAYVLEAAGHVFLAVEVIGACSPAPGGSAPRRRPFRRRPRRRRFSRLSNRSAPFFQGEGVDGDVGGVQSRHGVQTAAEARRGVRGKARNQIHIDGTETRVHRFAVGAKQSAALWGRPQARKTASSMVWGLMLMRSAPPERIT